MEDTTGELKQLLERIIRETEYPRPYQQELMETLLRELIFLLLRIEQGDTFPEITEGEGTNLYINKMRERNRRTTDSTVLARSEVNKGHFNMLDRFVDCILLDAPSPCNEVDGARATLMCLKAVNRSGWDFR